MRMRSYRKITCFNGNILKISYLDLRPDLENFSGYNVKGINSLFSKLFKYIIVCLK